MRDHDETESHNMFWSESIFTDIFTDTVPDFVEMTLCYLKLEKINILSLQTYILTNEGTMFSA